MKREIYIIYDFRLIITQIKITTKSKMINNSINTLLFDTPYFALYEDPILLKNQYSQGAEAMEKKDASPTNTKEFTLCESNSIEESFSDSISSTENSKIYKSFNETPYEEIIGLVHSTTTDLNSLIEDVLSSGPKDPTVKRKRVVTQKNTKRLRKTKDQIEGLQDAYEIESDWEKEDVLALSSKLGLSSSQVYKWYWDQQKKQGKLRGKKWE